MNDRMFYTGVMDNNYNIHIHECNSIDIDRIIIEYGFNDYLGPGKPFEIGLEIKE